MKKLSFLIAVVALLLIAQTAGMCVVVPRGPSPWYPLLPYELDPTQYCVVRLWILGHDPLYNPSGPVRWHELTDAEFAAMDEDRYQTVPTLRYDPPNPVGRTLYGMYHLQLNFVLWMDKVPELIYGEGKVAQVGETTKDKYDPTKTPAENDAAGNIDWFRVDGTWYPRTWTTSRMHAGQTWDELWGPFDDEFRARHAVVSFVKYTFKGRKYPAVKVTITGPSESDPDHIWTTEAFTFIHTVGIVERYIDDTTLDPPPDGYPANTMIFKHIAKVTDIRFPRQRQ